MTVVEVGYITIEITAEAERRVLTSRPNRVGEEGEKCKKLHHDFGTPDWASSVTERRAGIILFPQADHEK